MKCSPPNNKKRNLIIHAVQQRRPSEGHGESTKSSKAEATGNPAEHERRNEARRERVLIKEFKARGQEDVNTGERYK